MRDCVIVGGGPAGLTAALYLARFLRSVTVIDAQDGRAQLIPKTHNLAPFPDGISGLDLLGRMRGHACQYGAVVEPGTVRSVAKQDGVFHITTDSRTLMARTVIFATGVFNHRPSLSSGQHAQGLALGLIRYCPVCDAYEVRDKRIAVLGHGDHGTKEARFISHYSPFVTLIPPDGSVGVPQTGIAALSAPMQRISLSETEVIVTLGTGASHHFDTLYVALGTTARSDLADGLGLRLDAGHIAVDSRQRTSLDGASAIGDVTDGLDQIAAAMGQGAIAAAALHNSLTEKASRALTQSTAPHTDGPAATEPRLEVS